VADGRAKVSDVATKSVAMLASPMQMGSDARMIPNDAATLAVDNKWRIEETVRGLPFPRM
jgi:hypothetical protein